MLIRDRYSRSAGDCDPVVAAIDHAIGIRHFFLRNQESGQWERLTDPDQMTEALNKGHGFWIYTKDPSVQAFTDLMNRHWITRRTGGSDRSGQRAGDFQVAEVKRWIKRLVWRQ
jgi:hypothetical protein